jgi:hypothetical protein
MTEPTETTTPASPEPKAVAVATPQALPSDDKAATRRDEWLEALSRNPRFVLIKPSGKGYVIGGQSPKALTTGVVSAPAYLRQSVAAACLAIAEEAEASEAERHHRPSRGFGDGGADVEREALVGPSPPRPFVDAGRHAEAAEGRASICRGGSRSAAVIRPPTTITPVSQRRLRGRRHSD